MWEPQQHNPSGKTQALGPWRRSHTVAAAVDGALVEDHDVLGEGACLVREDVLHLAQLLVQGGGAGLRGRPLLHAEHLLVPVDEVAVAQADDLHAAQGTGGEAGGRKGRGTPPPWAFAAGPPPGEKQERSGYLGKDTWVGEGKESLKVGVPDPDPLTLSRQKRCKGPGQAGQTAQAEERGLQTRHSTRSYLRTNNTETMQRKQEKVQEGRKRKKKREKEIMRVLHVPQAHRRPCRERKPRRPWSPCLAAQTQASSLLPPGSGLHSLTWGVWEEGGAD